MISIVKKPAIGDVLTAHTLDVESIPVLGPGRRTVAHHLWRSVD